MAAYVADAINGNTTTLNITSSTNLKVGPGVVACVSLPVVGSGAGTINDIDTVGGAAAGNVIMAVPTTLISPAKINWAFNKGLTVIPGTGQTICVAWS